MADPTSPEAPCWFEDVETTKSLLSHPSLRNNRVAARCLAVVNRLCSPTFSGTTASSNQGQQPFFMPFPDQFLAQPSFGMFPDVDQEVSMNGIVYSDWFNFPISGEMS